MKARGSNEACVAVPDSSMHSRSYFRTSHRKYVAACSLSVPDCAKQMHTSVPYTSIRHRVLPESPISSVYRSTGFLGSGSAALPFSTGLRLASA
eukprot:2969203-Rhodomonas_salina.8